MAPRAINRLSARKVESITKGTIAQPRRRYADGGGLYLSVSPNGGLRWVFQYVRHTAGSLRLGSVLLGMWD
jgi:hypothetical protein